MAVLVKSGIVPVLPKMLYKMRPE